MKTRLISILLLLILFSVITACENNDSERNYNIKLQIKYPENTYPKQNIIFYVYEKNSGILTQTTKYQTNTPLYLPQGEYCIIGLESKNKELAQSENLQSAYIPSSEDGSEFYYYSKATVSLNKENSEQVCVCKFRPLCGAIQILQDNVPLECGNNDYFTLTIDRPEGKEFLIDSEQTSNKSCTITSKPIHFSKQYNGTIYTPHHEFYLFPTPEETAAILTITFYDKNKVSTDKWTFTTPIPIKSGMITSAKINFSAIDELPINITINQKPFEYTDIYVAPSDYIYIEEKNLREALKWSFYSAFDKQDRINRLHNSITSAKYLNLGGRGIKDLSPVYNLFKNIIGLTINNNKLTQLDLSHFPLLTSLSCNNNNLIKLDLSPCPELEIINCNNNQLEELTTTHCDKLWEIYCDNNNLKTLDLSDNPALLTLFCTNNKLTNINIRQCSLLTNFFCDYNQLVNLDISQNNNLIAFNCTNNLLTSLDVSNNEKLTGFGCDNNKLQELILCQEDIYTNIDCSNNLLTQLNLSFYPTLAHLNCPNNLLTELDLTHNPGIKSINCHDNYLQRIILNSEIQPELMQIRCTGKYHTFTDIEGLSGKSSNLWFLHMPYSARNGTNIVTTYKKIRPQEWYYIDENGIEQEYWGGDDSD